MPATLPELLSSAGVAVVLGFLTSYVFQNWAPFQALTAQRKRLFLAVLAAGLSVLVQAINTYVPSATIAELSPWYVAIVAAVQLVAGEAFHQTVNR
jgi:putative flippase GtrA